MILLTGATGFLGSRLLKRLVENKYEVVCTRRAQSDTARVSEVYGLVRWFDTDREKTEALFDRNEIRTIIHCATNYGRNSADYFKAYEANLVFPLQLARCAQKYGCTYFINTGTFFSRELECLRDGQERVYMDAYVRSKDMFSRIIRNHMEELRFAFINLQMEHIYGNGDSEGKFVNRLVKSLLDNVPVVGLSEGAQKRDWIYVDDAVSAYLAVLNSQQQFQPGEFYHLEAGTGTETSLREFAQLVREKSGSTSRLEFGKYRMDEKELKSSHADTAALRRLGWKPRYDIQKGVEQMIKGRME